ncbi:uncharacterized protein LOC116266476 isoform X1 [Nymphaea colorata]|nr:uncharacterized protein LOC116266476 isoform X1 [Nymphaea colorata]XP_031503589.1 uncharacterized protein LOC116266476 isoform X1 [Nymphaea colorata]XP_031503590.1 uncharacterized protein LOC116266476 isoform X1 [Nymphaea colorata]XP_049936993.1 uncharacterized protein LOC116266476 isoform X1 [Nymphaea colorata]XP_049936994.1 uncharacterized protein LOC116266476 isoform X1 [Nymphaea colorata]XP_049936995.1 uncharacterized protein LOC116266476 isoform X1 [Nymphaea colorata]XP_049936996.1 un
MPRQREKCPKDPELIRLRNRERQQQCRARKREKARKDAGAVGGDPMPLMGYDHYSRRQDDARVIADVCSYPLVNQVYIPEIYGTEKADKKSRYLELFKGTKPKSTPDFRINEADGSVQLDSNNGCYGRDSLNIPQFSKTTDRNSGLDVLAAATKHLTESWEQLCNSESQATGESADVRHQPAGLQIISQTAEATSVERRTRIHCCRKWKKDARMADKYKQALVLFNAPASPSTQIEKFDMCSLQLSHHDLDVAVDVFSSLGKFSSKHQVNQIACKAKAVSHGRRNWKAAARAGGWDSTVAI